MILIGLTGGIGTGKTTVSNFLLSNGIPIIDADKIAHKVVEPNSKCWRLIRKEFGEQAIVPDTQQINRPYLASVIFKNPEKRRVLNRITHPEIQKQTLFKLLINLLLFRSIVVLDIPLLFESSVYRRYMNYIVVVKCTEEQQKERIKARNGFTDEEATSRILAQMPLEEKCRLADFVIDNTGEVGHTISQVKDIFRNKLHYGISYWTIRTLLITGYIATSLSLAYLLRLFFTLVYNK